MTPLSLTTVGVAMELGGYVEIWDWTLGICLRTLAAIQESDQTTSVFAMVPASGGHVTLAMRSLVVRGFLDDWEASLTQEYDRVAVAGDGGIVTVKDGEVTWWRGQDRVSVVAAPGFQARYAEGVVVGSRLVIVADGTNAPSLVIGASHEQPRKLTEARE